MPVSVVKNRRAKKQPRQVVTVSAEIHAKIRDVVAKDGRKIQWWVDKAIREALERGSDET